MLAFAIAFTVVGIAGCVMCAVAPHMVQRNLDRGIAFARARWANSNILEKIGLILMIVPIPGPFDEFIGLVFLGAGRIVRLLAERERQTVYSIRVGSHAWME